MTGTTLQNYFIESLLGEGGMGSVYKATDLVLGRQVAIKSLNISLTNQPAFLERFKNEAKTLARLAHPNIAMLYNYLKEGNDYYMVMEYVEGKDLDELTKSNKKLPYEVVVPLMLQALDGLAHAHKKGVLHRDIKPANLMLTPENIVKLMDFGIAKVSDSAKLTQISKVIGTLEFISPELIEGGGPSPASDIYAAGVTMYEMLTGKLPFTGKSDYMLMQEIVKERPAAPVSFNATVPKQLSDVILKALEKKPEDRFQSATAFSNELQATFPDLKTIPAGFLNQVTIKNAGVPKKNNVLHASPPATILYKESLPTQLVSINQKQNGLIAAISKNKLPYIAAVVLLIMGFTMFRVFSNKTEKEKLIDNPHDITTIAQNMADENITTGNDVATNHINNDSIAFILNKKKQVEEQQQGPSSQPALTAENKKPVAKKPNKKTGQAVADKTSEKSPQKVKPDSADNTSITPASTPPQPGDEDAVDISPGHPIVLRGHGLPVKLVLQENINKQTASEGQHVSFKVMEPAMLKGDVIIPTGSVINGTIKGLGSKRMSIIFNTVITKGRQIRLDRSEAGANMENVFSGNIFRVNLRGTLVP